MIKSKLVLITDLDGTLYNSAARQHLAQAGQWDDFHKASSTDAPNMDILRLLEIIWSSGYAVVGATGRNERYREITVRWLAKHGVLLDALLMRPDNDFSSDAVIKLKQVDDWLRDNDRTRSDILAVLEDREKMVDAWRAAGVPCWQVREGGY